MVNSLTPRLVEPGDLYDGPEPPAPGVNFLPPPPESKGPRSRPDYVATITAALDMLGARIVVLIAVFAACMMWGFAVYEPELQRTYAAIAFSLTVFLPAVALYWRRG
jgi:hypothetical protein